MKKKKRAHKLNEEKAKIKQQAEEENVLKLREREKIIDDLKQQVETVGRRSRTRLNANAGRSARVGVRKYSARNVYLR